TLGATRGSVGRIRGTVPKPCRHLGTVPNSCRLVDPGSSQAGGTRRPPTDTTSTMGILDRFKTQPKWKASDPAVRAAGLQEIPEDEQDLLAAIVRDDDDPRVRRAA